MSPNSIPKPEVTPLPPYSEDQIEQICRILSKKRGHEPNLLMNVPMKNLEGYPDHQDLALWTYQWRTYEKEVVRHLQLQDAIDKVLDPDMQEVP